MFNWVCPRCGRENSPSYTECPDCKERDLQSQAAATEEVPLPPREWQAPYQPPPPAYNPPPQYVQQAPPQYAPQPQYAPPPPQYAPPQQYAQPPQQYAPQQQQPHQYQPEQQRYNQTQPVYVQQPPQQYAPPRQQYAPPAPQAPPPPQPKPKPAYVPPSTPAAPEVQSPGFAARLGMLPVPILMLLFAAIFLLVGAGIYYGYQRFGKSNTGFSGGDQAAAVIKPKAINPMQRYIEVAGIRLTTDSKKRPIAKFVLVNHGSAELSGLGGSVTLWAGTSRSEEDAVGSFVFSIPSIGANESKEVSAPFKTKLKVYELPDWQNATPDLQITSPQQ